MPGAGRAGYDTLTWPHLGLVEMAIWARRTGDLTGLVNHSDRGVQYLAIRYTERLADAGAAYHQRLSATTEAA